jgi:hypothetical protein
MAITPGKISFLVTERESLAFIEIQKDGSPTSQENAVIDQDYGTVLEAYRELKDVSGQLAVVSGVPGDILTGLALELKNRFTAIAVHNPRLKSARVIHSVNPNHPYGSLVPLS